MAPASANSLTPLFVYYLAWWGLLKNPKACHTAHYFVAFLYCPNANSGVSIWQRVGNFLDVSGWYYFLAVPQYMVTGEWHQLEENIGVAVKDGDMEGRQTGRKKGQQKRNLTVSVIFPTSIFVFVLIVNRLWTFLWEVMCELKNKPKPLEPVFPSSCSWGVHRVTAALTRRCISAPPPPPPKITLLQRRTAVVCCYMHVCHTLHLSDRWFGRGLGNP